MRNNPQIKLPLCQELICQNFLMQVDCMSIFLDTAIKTITATGKKLTEKEQHGFSLCIKALAHNVEGAVNAGAKLQEMGARHG